MLRRFEIFSLSPEAADDPVRALERACRRCGEYIPEVLYSRVGWSRTEEPAHFVWENAYASPETYQRYMVHPYHAAVLDRYLLHDSPERVVSDDRHGAGLIGYTCDGPVFDLAAGIRRLVLLRVDLAASPAAVRQFEDVLGAATDQVDEMILSVVGANTFGPAWFDAVTPIAGPPRWTHIWEQGFADQDGLDTYLAGPSRLADAERRQWDGAIDGVVTRATSLHYEIDGPGPAAGDTGKSGPPRRGGSASGRPGKGQ